MTSIDNSCDEILSVAQHCEDEIQSLQMLKNKLYDEFNLVFLHFFFLFVFI